MSIEGDFGHLIQQRRQPAGVIVVSVTDGQSADRLWLSAQQLQIVQQHCTALASVEKDAPTLGLDQKGHPVLAPKRRVIADSIVYHAGYFH